jgi:hypothetical protein
MPQRSNIFCNFYIRVDREALVSERALDVGSVAFKAMSTKNVFTRHPRLRMNWSNIEKWRKLLKIGAIVLLSMLKYCAKFKNI